MTSKFSVLYYHILNFTTFVTAFADYKRHAFLHKVNYIFSYIRNYFVNSDENYWREGQWSERTDLKNNGFFIAHLSLKCSNIAILINARRLSSVVCLSCVAEYLL